MLINHPVPYVPAMPAPTPAPAVTRVRKHGYYTYCEICQLEVSFCKGHTVDEAQAGDGDSSDLERRVRAARAAAGGR